MGAKKFNKFAILMAIFACVALNCILAEAHGKDILEVFSNGFRP